MMEKIRQLQLSIMKNLIEIKRICDENNLVYILDAGTMLGAVRHSGFIPWDDDADIAMPRDDYEKFINLCLKEKALSPEFEIQCYEKDKHYCDSFIRIRQNNTKCVIGYHKERGYSNLGVFVDIFPLDYSYTNNIKILEKRIIKIKRIERSICNKLTLTHNTLLSKLNNLRLRPVSLEKLFYKKTKLESCLDKERNYVTSTYTSYTPNRVTFPITIITDRILVNFEGINFYISRDYDLYLKTMYGDYITLPPIEKRIAHIPEEISL